MEITCICSYGDRTSLVCLADQDHQYQAPPGATPVEHLQSSLPLGQYIFLQHPRVT